jgi:hypothetical protein
VLAQVAGLPMIGVKHIHLRLFWSVVFLTPACTAGSCRQMCSIEDAKSDFQNVIKLKPTHSAAAKELAALSDLQAAFEQLQMLQQAHAGAAAAGGPLPDVSAARQVRLLPNRMPHMRCAACIGRMGHACSCVCDTRCATHACQEELAWCLRAACNSRVRAACHA